MPAQQSSKPADNTGVNRADRAAGQPTAEQAKNDRPDRDLMKQIRKDIVSDKSLSTYAHNVKVIANQGKVTLEGPVRSEEERKAVVGKAAAVVGAENVTDQLTVKEGAKTSQR
jgi:hyperosmotically inducible protein